jgi:hypothetical protein
MASDESTAWSIVLLDPGPCVVTSVRQAGQTDPPSRCHSTLACPSVGCGGYRAFCCTLLSINSRATPYIPAGGGNDACRKEFLTTESFMPFRMRCVANVWRREWTDAFRCPAYSWHGTMGMVG